MLREHLFHNVFDYVNRNDFKSDLSFQDTVKVEFLAQGEYNLNYLLHTSRGKLVLRVNTASQMHLDNQIAYEFKALQLLDQSGVTPKPYFLDDSMNHIPFGLLIMEYLPGEPLDYRYDLVKAAGTFAKIHGLQLAEKSADFLVTGSAPFSSIFNEASSLLQKYFQCPKGDYQIQLQLEKVLLQAEHKVKEEKYLIQEPWLTVINTEVNSHNFIVNQEKQSCHLIDWEKPILGEPAQDLSMFLIATTTMWKRNYLLSPDEEEAFISQYDKNIPDCSYKTTLRERIEMFKFFNYLRAISWCAMAWTEYTNMERQLVNPDTFNKISTYLNALFIQKIFAEVF